jgi:hypothetical protein
MNRNQASTLAGSVLAMLGTAWLIDRVAYKKQSRALMGELLAVGAVGLATGAVLAYLPVHRAKKKLTRQEVLSRRDVERMNRNLSELLGRSER